jgi:hypothetical protein
MTRYARALDVIVIGVDLVFKPVAVGFFLHQFVFVIKRTDDAERKHEE